MIINVLVIKISIARRRYVFYEKDANFFLVVTRLSNRRKSTHRELPQFFAIFFPSTNELSV